MERPETPAPDRLIVRPDLSALPPVIRVPGDKSVSHRAVLFGAMAEGTTVIRGLLRAEDVHATLQAARQLGARVEEVPDPADPGATLVRVTGAPWHGAGRIGCGNSGTTCRLLLGALAGRAAADLTGDASLSRRPMGRVIRPLQAMGAQIVGGPALPISVAPAPLAGITWRAEVDSAQVKSAILLAGLCAAGPTTYVEPRPTRDHTERMFRAMGADLNVTPGPDGDAITVRPGALRAAPVDVPGDISSAAFWLVAASILPGADLVLPGVGVTPARTGVLAALGRMGADIARRDLPGFEPTADLRARYAPLRATTIAGDEIPTLIDEIPILAVAAAFAEGETVIRDAAELRVKESDRVRATLDLLRAIGAQAEELPDGLRVWGDPRLGLSRPAPPDPVVHSRGDHRIAMAAAVAGLRLGCTVEDTACIATSYPGFLRVIAPGR